MRFRCTRWRAANRNCRARANTSSRVMPSCSAVLAGEQRIETSPRSGPRSAGSFRCTRWRAANRNPQRRASRCTSWGSAVLAGEQRIETLSGVMALAAIASYRSAVLAGEQRIETATICSTISEASSRSAVLAGEQRIETFRRMLSGRAERRVPLYSLASSE